MSTCSDNASTPGPAPPPTPNPPLAPFPNPTTQPSLDVTAVVIKAAKQQRLAALWQHHHAMAAAGGGAALQRQLVPFIACQVQAPQVPAAGQGDGRQQWPEGG